MNATRYLALGLLFGLAACSQGGNSVVPGTAAAAPQSRHSVRAHLVIKVPRELKAAPARGTTFRPRPLASRTASTAVAQTPVVVATSNPNCNVAGQTYLQCAIPFNVAPGAHTFSFTAKDSNGVALSANTNYPFTDQDRRRE